MQTTLETFIAFCIGLILPTTSYDLVGKFRFSFIVNEKHMAYRFSWVGYYNHTIPECNELMVRLGVVPIRGSRLLFNDTL